MLLPPFQYQQPHYGHFVLSGFAHQGPGGFAPFGWVQDNEHHLPDVPNAHLLPPEPLDRLQLREICQNVENPVLFGYICVMAWGGQGQLNGNHIAAAWAQRDLIEENLDLIRHGGLTKIAAYNLFRNDEGNLIAGLGPPFFTKLIYFFSPEPNFYIMDQFTSRSITTGSSIHLTLSK